MGLIVIGLAGAVISAAISSPLGMAPGVVLLNYAVGGTITMLVPLAVLALHADLR